MEYGLMNGSGYRLGAVPGNANLGSFTEQVQTAKVMAGAGEDLDRMALKDAEYEDREVAGSAIRGLKARVKKLEKELGEDPADWEERLKELKDDFVSEERRFHSREMQQGLRFEAEDVLRTAADRFSTARKMARAKRVAENFRWELKDAEDEGNFQRARALVMGADLPDRQKVSMVRRYDVAERDQRFYGMLDNPLKAIDELETGEFGKGLDEKVKAAYMGKASAALAHMQSARAERLAEEGFVNGRFASDEQLRELVKEQALGYKDARDYQVARDRMRKDGRAFDKGQYEAMRSAVCAYDPEKDESRVGLSQLNAQIGLVTAPPESKAHLRELLGMRTDVRTGSAVKMAGELADADFQAGVFVPWPKDEYGDRLSLSSGGEALDAHRKALEVKARVSDMMEKEIRRAAVEGRSVAPEEVSRLYRDVRGQVVLESAGEGALDMLLSPGNARAKGLVVPGRASAGVLPVRGRAVSMKEAGQVTEDGFYGVRKADVSHLSDEQALNVLARAALKGGGDPERVVQVLEEASRWVREVLRKTV